MSKNTKREDRQVYVEYTDTLISGRFSNDIGQKWIIFFAQGHQWYTLLFNNMYVPQNWNEYLRDLLKIIKSLT